MLPKFPAVRDAIAQTRGRTVTVRMMSFGGTSSKGLWLIGTAPWLEELEEISRDNRPCDLSAVGTLVRRDAAGRVTGKVEDLQESEEYTPEFTEPWL